MEAVTSTCALPMQPLGVTSEVVLSITACQAAALLFIFLFAAWMFDGLPAWERYALRIGNLCMGLWPRTWSSSSDFA